VVEEEGRWADWILVFERWEVDIMPDVMRRVTTYKYEFRRVGSENVVLVDLEAEGELVCRIALVEGDEPLPAPQEHVGGWVAVAMRSSQLHDLIDMLRNEQPVYFTWSGAPANIARITTQEEPVGEEERRRGVFGFLFG
jgi:hypothetical protein